ncbi:hypothetical protein H8959_013600 [Pygathrix nigripes]
MDFPQQPGGRWLALVRRLTVLNFKNHGLLPARSEGASLGRLEQVSTVLDLCDSVKDDALRVIPAFNIPHTNLHAPIAGISNPRSVWAFYPAPLQPLPREGARSQRPKLGAKL